MPIYEYRCDTCGHQHEHLCKLNAKVIICCPDCGSEAYQKCLSVSAPIFLKSSQAASLPICPTTGQACGRCYER